MNKNIVVNILIIFHESTVPRPFSLTYRVRNDPRYRTLFCVLHS